MGLWPGRNIPSELLPTLCLWAFHGLPRRRQASVGVPSVWHPGGFHTPGQGTKDKLGIGKTYVSLLERQVGRKTQRLFLRQVHFRKEKHRLEGL